MTVILIDQFGNKHKIKKVIFKGRNRQEPAKAEPSGESIHAIPDPIEKEIVAVLKDELNRYKQCGRPEGGLGSVHTLGYYENRPTPGIPPNWSEEGSPKQQSIVANPEVTSIHSDNATALLSLHSGLADDEERSGFVAALLRRLDRTTEYAPVGYLILLVLFRIGRLPDALNKAKMNLENDGAYGFSDFLLLLDGLMRFEHPSFTSEMLDEVERCTEGLNEHTFRIRGRIAAIRAYRLATQRPNAPPEPED